MSIITRGRPNAVSVQAREARSTDEQVYCVAWLVSRAAARAALAGSRPEITVAPSRTSDSVRIVWRVCIEPTGASTFAATVQASIEDPEHRASAVLGVEARGIAIRDVIGADELFHVEVPGALVCTLRSGRTLYASSPLLAALGLEGGRYDVIV